MKKLCFFILLFSVSLSLMSQEVDLRPDFKNSRKLLQGYYIYLMLKLEDGRVVFDIDGFKSSHRVLKNNISSTFSSQDDYFQEPVEVLAGGEIEVNSNGLISKINETTSLVNTRPDIAGKMRTPSTAIQNIKDFIATDPKFASLFSEDVEFIAFDENNQHLNLDFKSSRIIAHEVGSVVTTLFVALQLSNSLYDDYLNNKNNIRAYIAEALKDFIGKKEEVIERYPFLEVYFDSFNSRLIMDKQVLKKEELKELYVKLYLALEDFKGDHLIGWFLSAYNAAKSSFSGLEIERLEVFLRYYLAEFVSTNAPSTKTDKEDPNIYNADILISRPELIYDLFLVLYESVIGEVPVDREDFIKITRVFMFENKEKELKLMFILKRILEIRYPEHTSLVDINSRLNALTIYPPEESSKTEEEQKKIINTTKIEGLGLRVFELQKEKTRSMIELYVFDNLDANRSNIYIVDAFLTKVLVEINSSDPRDVNTAMGLLFSKDVVSFIELSGKDIAETASYDCYIKMINAIKDYRAFVRSNSYNLSIGPNIIRVKNQKLNEMIKSLEAYKWR